jgi:hypothetical protein
VKKSAPDIYLGEASLLANAELRCPTRRWQITT